MRFRRFNLADLPSTENRNSVTKIRTRARTFHFPDILESKEYPFVYADSLAINYDFSFFRTPGSTEGYIFVRIREIGQGAAKGICMNIGLGSLNILKMRLRIIISYIGITKVDTVETTFLEITFGIYRL